MRPTPRPVPVNPDLLRPEHQPSLHLHARGGAARGGLCRQPEPDDQGKGAACLPASSSLPVGLRLAACFQRSRPPGSLTWDPRRPPSLLWPPLTAGHQQRLVGAGGRHQRRSGRRGGEGRRLPFCEMRPGRLGVRAVQCQGAGPREAGCSRVRRLLLQRAARHPWRPPLTHTHSPPPTAHSGVEHEHGAVAPAAARGHLPGAAVLQLLLWLLRLLCPPSPQPSASVPQMPTPPPHLRSPPPTPPPKQARVRAVRDASAIAATLAEAAGVALGAIASIADSNVAPTSHEFAGPRALRHGSLAGPAAAEASAASASGRLRCRCRPVPPRAAARPAPPPTLPRPALLLGLPCCSNGHGDGGARWARHDGQASAHLHRRRRRDGHGACGCEGWGRVGRGALCPALLPCGLAVRAPRLPVPSPPTCARRSPRLCTPSSPLQVAIDYRISTPAGAAAPAAEAGAA